MPSTSLRREFLNQSSSTTEDDDDDDDKREREELNAIESESDEEAL